MSVEPSVAVSQQFDSLSDKLQAWKIACLQSSEFSTTTKDALRSEGRTFFQFLVQQDSSSKDGVVSSTMKAVHEEAIAKLIQEMEPAFCSRHSSRASALLLLCGAIEGVQSAKLSINTIKIIGSFLLGHCNPLETEMMDGGVGYDEIVRDSAVVCLSALVKSRLAARDETDIVESVHTRLDLAMKGLESRCAVPETERDDYRYTQNSGLSMLPRSRRSICFDLLRSAVDGVAAVCDQSDAGNISLKIFESLSTFASFAATCLHGESDPRCLLQLLDLLRAVQVTFEPYFLPSKAAAFPAREIFEAVAPYYPVQFTPPPNNVHGITRHGLHALLMAVLCEVKLGKVSGPDSMLNLTAPIFLERISPPEDDDTTITTNTDILEAINDLDTLLFPGSDSNVGQLEESTVRAVAIALFSAHTKASFGISEPDDNGKKAKSVADECRTLVSKIAFHLESSKSDRLWNIFVVETLRKQSPLLASSPQSSQGRSSVAYIAALAACGGPRTLRICLDSCLPSLVDILQNEAHDEEKLTAAVYGIAEFFSSSRVAIHRASSQAVEFYPHPLRPYSSLAFRGMSTLLDISDNKTPDSKHSKLKSTETQIAGVRAMESVLMASPQDHLRGDDLRHITYFLDYIVSVVVSRSGIKSGNESEVDLDMRKACCRTLGNLLGRALQNPEGEFDSKSNVTCVIEEVSALHEHLRKDIFQQLLTSVGGGSAEKTAPRFDRMVLAFACKGSLVASHEVVGLLVSSLCDALKSSPQSNQVVCFAKTLSFVFRHGGPFVSKSFHELSPPSATIEDILDILGSTGDTTSAVVTQWGTGRPNLDVGMSMLKLPASAEELDELAKASQRSYEIAFQIRPAYEVCIPSEQLVKLVDRVSQVLPPLDDFDNVKLCFSLPLLATALTSTRRLRFGTNNQHSDCVVAKLESIASALATYALSLEHNATARSAAVACLCEIIRGCPASATEPMFPRLVSEIIVPSMEDAPSCIKSATVLEGLKFKAGLRDSLFLLASLGSVAACAGFSSGTADEIVRFLVEISCSGSSRAPFGDEVLDLSIGGKFSEAQIVSSSAFGSMLSVDDAGPFWKQRLVHVALKHIDFPVGGENLEFNQPSLDLPHPSRGVLNVFCHITGSSKIGALGKGVIKAVAREILGGLNSMSGQEDATFALPLVVAAIIKLLCEATSTMSECLTLVILVLSRVFNKLVKNDLKGFETEILVLQAFASVAHNYKGNRSLELCKSAVLAVVNKCRNHPSRLLRQAAMIASNEWSVV